VPAADGNGHGLADRCLLAPVFAWVLCAPKFLAGSMTLGELTQAAAAFVMVQSAFNWVVDNYQRLADWRSSAYRVATLLRALDDVDRADSTAPPQQADIQQDIPAAKVSGDYR
jgi:vitamin B12/bleomycin/antimicrobial peptide transport system ATP-binding/permease protein